MKFSVVSIPYAKAANVFSKTLYGRIFHITTPQNFIDICKSGSIQNNKDGRLNRRNWGETSYFANRGCVSVCDLVNNTQPRKTKKKFTQDYKIFNPGVSVFLFLSPKIHENVVTWHESKKEKNKLQIVPFFESGYPNQINLDDIEEALFIDIDYGIPPETIAALDMIYAKNP